MKYYKFINKGSGATSHLPKVTIDRIQANPKQAKTIEILYECDENGNKIEENAEVVTAPDNDIKSKTNEQNEQTEETPAENGTLVRKNKWGGQDEFKRTGNEQSTYY